MYSIDGKVVYKSTNNKKEINLSNIENGIYTISIDVGNTIFNKIIVKE